MRILVVEDDPLLADGLQAGLKQAGFDADRAQDGVEADLALRSHSYVAVLLDLGLPRLDGLALLKRLRERSDRVPVLILTARDAIDQRIQGLDSGADDYVVKPVDLGELAARLRALVRRSKGEAASILEAGELRLDPAAHEVIFRGRPVELQPREFAMLQELMLNAGRVLSRDQLVERLYAWGEEIESNAIEVHVHHLRRKLAPDLIRTIRGVGYLLPRPQPE